VAIRVTLHEDPARALAEAEGFLASESVRNNLILTLLHARVAHPEPGRYWVASDGDVAIGVALQSPMSFPATVTRMPSAAVAAMVDAIMGVVDGLPGVSGEAAVAAQFAGTWTERRKSPAVPYQGMRLYEVDDVVAQDVPAGQFRRARADERDLVLGWVRAFQRDIGEHRLDAQSVVDRRLPAGQFFAWEDAGVVSMAAHCEPVAGVVRVQYVYTPPELRGRGYAQACVGELSRQMRQQGHRCMLFADLANPVSNSIYRRLGYRAVAELLKYRFE
jgi:predicted GNAT family acetyltransferase